MENKDKHIIDEQFKKAAGNAEDKGFAQMESIWNRVEEKLDATEDKKRIVPYWKYAGIAALLLLCLTVGNFIFRDSDNTIIAPNASPAETVVSIDTAKVETVVNPSADAVTDEQQVVVAPSPEKISNDIEKPIRKTVINKSSTEVTTKSNEPFPFKVTVTDSQGFPIPGVTVAVNGTPTAQTDFDGISTLKTKEGDKLTLNFIGMESKNIVASAFKSDVNIALADNTQHLDAVVVEGYRAISRKNTTSAVTTISSEAVASRAPTEEVQIIRDKQVSGGHQITSGYMPKDQTPVRIFTPRSDSGEFKIKGEITSKKTSLELLEKQLPGVKIVDQDELLKGKRQTSVVLRGSNSLTGSIDPLYVINGITATADDFRRIKSNDIKEVSVLKDQSATSVYGSRGANGVIVVTTKKPLPKKEMKRLEENDKLEKDKPARSSINVDTEEYDSFEENKFENPKTTPLSTFSIDVDNASYTNVRRFLNAGQTVPKDAVRVEEMINFFKYDYPQPKGSEPFSINSEYSDAPWNPQHKLLKIGLKGKEILTKDLPASNLVFLIDVSGSMNSADKLPLLKQSMKLVVNQMRKEDRVAIVVYAGAAGLVLPSTSGSEKEKIIAALDNLSAGGSTAGGEGIELAYKTAQENFIKKGNNRVILATDGDFNVGRTSDTDMQTLIEEKRKSGVFLTCLGYGMGNYKDSKMEILADKGNGNYAYIDNMQEAGRFLDKEFRGSMYAIAKDVKIQIEFNPAHVQSYRLIGYENRKLRDEDFANDAIDAGELGSGHTVTALYEIIPVGVKSEFFTAASGLKYSTPDKTISNNYGSELATIKFRHKKPDGEVSKETIKVVPDVSVSLQKASGEFKFAAAVAWFGLKLRDSKLVTDKNSEHIRSLAKQGLANDEDGYRAEFVRLVEMVR